MNTQTERIIDRLNVLGSISDEESCISRFFMTNAHVIAGKMISDWMISAKMEVRKDALGNIRGILRSKHSKAKHFVIGSHYDTVFNAGKYDGPLGIIMGIEIVQRIIDEDIELPFHLNIIAFADEEGARFNTAYLGSSAIAGNFDSKWLQRKDDKGATLHDVIIKNGSLVDSITKSMIPKKDWLGYFEIHIEQGPVLCNADLPVAVVNSIAAQARVNIKWEGTNGHAGTSPMHLRNDAFCGVAEFALAAEEIAVLHKEQLVATIGKCNVSPNTSNVIPGHVSHSLDIRSPNDQLLTEVMATLKEKALAIAKKRQLQCQWKIMQSNASVTCDHKLKTMLTSSIVKANINPVIEIPSGAGHDGVMISKIAPIAMLFVRCKDGISHNPKEYTNPKDIHEALNTCHLFMNTMIQSNLITNTST